MKIVRLKALLRTIARNPWASMQDALLLAMAMIVATLLALEYDLFWFVSVLSEPQRRISLAEAIFLTLLLALCIVAFVIRRLHEERRDIARRVSTKTQLSELRMLASQDSLTMLANRREMLKALGAATASALSPGRQHAFFLIDLNDFKRVNDLHGHALGDRVLQVVAQRFRTTARPSDLLARLGGDEFAVLSYNVDRNTAYEIGLRFIVTLASEISVGGNAHKIGASIGAAMIPDDGVTTEEVIHHADLAMYRAKGQDHSSLVFFEPTADYPEKLIKA
ncbi:MAG: GGDEF domain-containing protein [Methyloceanibacter sp.]